MILRYITWDEIYHRQVLWKTGLFVLTLRFLDVHLQTENAKIAGWSSW